MVNIKEYYDELTFDLSGSMTKNRFRNELLWGLKKILELHKKKLDYTVVFDYKCDIEVHLKNNLEFYQLKTQKDQAGYSLSKLLDSKKGPSILGTLFKLKINKGKEEDTKIAIVSNVPLKCIELKTNEELNTQENSEKKTKITKKTKIYSDTDELSFAEIDESNFNEIKKILKEELEIKQDIELKNTYFIRTGLDLFLPHKTLIGELSLFCEEYLGEEIRNLNSLWRVLECEILEKACYENKCDTYDELIQKKGFSKERFEKILENYFQKKENVIELIGEKLKERYKNNFSKKIKYLNLLAETNRNLKKSTELQKIYSEIKEYINNNVASFEYGEKEILEKVLEKIEDKKPVEITNEEIEILCLICLTEYEEGNCDKIIYK
ncbi:MAG: dsDNA nuclease domain-containing protein [Clostridium sp.]